MPPSYFLMRGDPDSHGSVMKPGMDQAWHDRVLHIIRPDNIDKIRDAAVYLSLTGIAPETLTDLGYSVSTRDRRQNNIEDSAVPVEARADH
jgi:hypothetical protein